jgi:RNA polymerase sigma factor (sigma-70 family)
MTQAVEDFEGLVFTTARMIAGQCREDEDDIRQLLRVKVWQALRSYDPQLAKQPVEKYVFMCMRNKVKDLVKLKPYGEVFIEDQSHTDAGRERWELRHLSATAEQVFHDVEEERPPLPSTLTELERRVALLLYADYNQTEVARLLGVGRKKVRTAHANIVIKMADWRPSTEELEPARLQAAA